MRFVRARFALLDDVPRVASCCAATDFELLALERDVCVSVVSVVTRSPGGGREADAPAAYPV